MPPHFNHHSSIIQQVETLYIHEKDKFRNVITVPAAGSCHTSHCPEEMYVFGSIIEKLVSQ